MKITPSEKLWYIHKLHNINRYLNSFYSQITKSLIHLIMGPNKNASIHSKYNFNILLDSISIERRLWCTPTWTHLKKTILIAFLTKSQRSLFFPSRNIFYITSTKRPRRYFLKVYLYNNVYLCSVIHRRRTRH